MKDFLIVLGGLVLIMGLVALELTLVPYLVMVLLGWCGITVSFKVCFAVLLLLKIVKAIFFPSNK